jgi:hypothetical protein
MNASVGWWRRSAIALLVVCVGLPLVRVYQVHDQGWEWRLTPSAAPPRLVFDGRSYLRGQHITRIPSGETAQGDTPGGGRIFADTDPRTDTVLFVRAGRHTFDYELQGGP